MPTPFEIADSGFANSLKTLGYVADIMQNAYQAQSRAIAFASDTSTQIMQSAAALRQQEQQAYFKQKDLEMEQKRLDFSYYSTDLEEKSKEEYRTTQAENKRLNEQKRDTYKVLATRAGQQKSSAANLYSYIETKRKQLATLEAGNAIDSADMIADVPNNDRAKINAERAQSLRDELQKLGGSYTQMQDNIFEYNRLQEHIDIDPTLQSPQPILFNPVNGTLINPNQAPEGIRMPSEDPQNSNKLPSGEGGMMLYNPLFPNIPQQPLASRNTRNSVEIPGAVEASQRIGNTINNIYDWNTNASNTKKTSFSDQMGKLIPALKQQGVPESVINQQLTQVRYDTVKKEQERVIAGVTAKIATTPANAVFVSESDIKVNEERLRSVGLGQSQIDDLKTDLLQKATQVSLDLKNAKNKDGTPKDFSNNLIEEFNSRYNEKIFGKPAPAASPPGIVTPDEIPILTDGQSVIRGSSVSSRKFQLEDSDLESFFYKNLDRYRVAYEKEKNLYPSPRRLNDQLGDLAGNFASISKEEKRRKVEEMEKLINKHRVPSTGVTYNPSMYQKGLF